MDSYDAQLLEHDPAWVTAFREEAELLAPVFGDALVRIEHHGSTAVPDLLAKPIIDIVALIEEKATADGLIGPLEDLGYTFFDYRSSERHFFRKGDPIRFHLSVGYADFSRFFERQVLFRDYLIEHEEARREYEELKRALLRQDSPGERSSSGKTDFVVDVLRRAGFDETAGW